MALKRLVVIAAAATSVLAGCNKCSGDKPEATTGAGVGAAPAAIDGAATPSEPASTVPPTRESASGATTGEASTASASGATDANGTAPTTAATEASSPAPTTGGTEASSAAPAAIASGANSVTSTVGATEASGAASAANATEASSAAPTASGAAPTVGATATSAATATTTAAKAHKFESKDIKVGSGAVATDGKTITIHYVGTFENGVKFDSSIDRDSPLTFQLGKGEQIKGWDQGIKGMKVGGKRRLVVPPDLGYGDKGVRGVIPPSSTLFFEVELLKVQ